MNFSGDSMQRGDGSFVGQGNDDLERYRGYLRVLTEMKLNPLLRKKVDISDVVQITLTRAHRSLNTFHGQSETELRAWLRAILNHQVINLAKMYTAAKRDIRREISIDEVLHRSTTLLLPELAAEQSTPSGRMIRQELADQLADAMATLLPDERAAITFKYIDGWKVNEIAEELGRSSDAIAGLLRRGIKKLRRQIAMILEDS
ncbi:sigma-70 family RNA polymerase sigma factor [Roseiconus nitratireducens]|nr:sigma-70 family RNA polymerase sigma factor [Roseiconus nitratireducens]